MIEINFLKANKIIDFRNEDFRKNEALNLNCVQGGALPTSLQVLKGFKKLKISGD